VQDAATVSKGPGVLSYKTTTPLKDVTPFYQEELPSLGWKAEGKPGTMDPAALLKYKKGNQTMTMIISAGDIQHNSYLIV
jgi:hypothetical protein